MPASPEYEGDICRAAVQTALRLLEDLLAAHVL